MRLNKYLHIFLAFGSLLYVSAIIIRVRTPSGVLKRIEITDETPTDEFIRIIQEKGYASARSTYSIGNRRVEGISRMTGSFVEDFKFRKEDIVSILDDTGSCKLDTPSVNSNIAAKVLARRSSRQTSNMQSLPKITREKVTNSVRAEISLSSGRILKRISNGGLGIALGKVRISKARRIQDTQDIKRIEVHAVIELISSDSSQVNDILPWVISQSFYEEMIKRIQSVAEKLGLSVVGCVVGLPLKSTQLLWSSYHLHILLQSQSILQKPLVMISVTDLRHSKKRNTFSNKDLGISLEAFILSNQSVSLNAQNILPTNPAPSYQTELKLSIEDSSILNKEESIVGSIMNVNLNSEVMIQGKKSKAVDALLFAVPIPVKPLTLREARNYEHSFPSNHELKDVKMQRLARKHVLKILEVSSKSIFRLRDLHLLMYLQAIIDDASFTALCESLSNDSVIESGRLPGVIVAVLDMIRMIMSE